MEKVIMFIKDWGALILTFLGIIGGFYAYLKYGRKLKCQKIKLNETLIKQNEQEEVEEKMAKIRCEVAFDHKKILFINDGRADALNVRIKILTPENVIRSSFIREPKWGPYDVIHPKSQDFGLMTLGADHIDKIDLEITWDDQFGTNRTDTQTVTISKS